MVDKSMSGQRFHRTSHTWNSYLMLAFYAFLQAMWGPIMPLLRAELDLNFTIGGFHATAFAIGMVLAGLTADIFVNWFSEKIVFWGGSCGMAIGGILLIMATNAAMTITSAFVMGLLGTLVLVVLQSTLAGEHGKYSTRAITEANVCASVGASSAPLLVSLFVWLLLGWRYAVICGVIFWFILFLRGRQSPFPNMTKTQAQQISSTRLPVKFWVLWIVIVLGVAAEWSVTLWTADFLIEASGFEFATASLSVAVYAISAIVGRLIASRLSDNYSVHTLLLATLFLALLGAIVFWVSSDMIWSFVALSFIGLGIANAYPLGASIALSIAPDQPNIASARATLGASVAILVAPQTLGIVADLVSITNAYGIVIALIVGAIILTGTVTRMH